MTICFKTYPDMKRFCGKMFTGDTKDNTLPVFSNCNLSFNFKQVHVICDEAGYLHGEYLVELQCYTHNPNL